MASEQQVKRYLAYWFQLGKKVVIHKDCTLLLPKSVYQGERYSQEFETIWQRVILPDSGDCYLEGTTQTIAELLTQKWDIEPCFRCDMPVPVINIGLPPESCTCYDLPTWPNTELPAPREPGRSKECLSLIRDRLGQSENQPDFDEDTSPGKKGE
ncbi:MAG TPA: hypothetical protein DD379_08765 [Cyanobacteria bacterium UBA11162]|nr:hypothetical protein [Cyanobacteria bacterium UBA11162]